jgi:hypothetical protein
LGISNLARSPKPLLIRDFAQWQVGESFTYVYHNPSYFDEYQNHRVMARYESPSGDSVVLYTELRQAAFDRLTSGNNTFFPMELDTLVYTSNNLTMLKMATGELNEEFGLLYLPTYWAYAGSRIERNYLRFDGSFADLDSTGAYSGGLLTQDGCIAWPHRYFEDLGRVFWRQRVGSTTTTTLYADHELICFTRSNEATICPQNALLTSVQSEIAADVKLWYSQNEAKIYWENMPEGNYDLRLMDMRGQILRQEAIRLSENGAQKIELPSLNGIYLLSLTNLETGNQKALKIALMN